MGRFYSCWSSVYPIRCGGLPIGQWPGPTTQCSYSTNRASYGSLREAAITLPWDGDVRQLRTLGAAVVPSPLVLGGLITIAITATYAATLGRMLATFWPALRITQVLAVGLAVLC
ncbi:MAG TPA: hypothetical protein VKU02_03565 [Gemmataceae bacterium]|nr:hypothetical protein [Gemmataceae bacterium]